MAKKTISGTNVGLVGTSTVNYIKQINDGTTTHDLALTKSISFFNGADGDAIVWDGTQAIEVVIPSVTDIIQDPVRFVGTVDSTGTITYTESGKTSPVKGDLVYITDTCTFAGQTCEGGDMAIHDGTAWRVISGENQVQIVGTDVNGNVDVLLTDTVASVLTVEGKTLRLGVNYDSLRGAMDVTKNASTTLNVANGTVVVAGMNLNLSQAAGTNISVDDISTSVSINLPTALANGNVTIDSVLRAEDFTFTAGSYPVATQNSAAVSATVSHHLSIGKAGEDGVTGDYVTSVSAVGGVTFASGNQSQHDLAYMTGLTAASGTSFLTGVHARGANEEGTAAFTIPGNVTVSGEDTFVSGLGDPAASGALVASISVGAVTLGTGEDILTGLSTTGSDVITSVSFGDAQINTTRHWFYSALTNGSDVVSDVTGGGVALVSGNNNAGQTGSAIISASVSEHVLSFNTDTFMLPVDVSYTAPTISKKGFTKSGVELSGYGTTAAGFTKGAISQAATSISYRDVLTGTINVALGNATDYIYDKVEEHAYAAVMGYSNLSITDATVTKNTPVLENTTITATIPANTFVESISEGTAPTLAVGVPTGTITGTVGTALTSTVESWLGVKSDASFEIPGAYSLVSVSEGGIEVAAASTYNVAGATVTIAANSYVTDVFVNDTAVAVSN